MLAIRIWRNRKLISKILASRKLLIIKMELFWGLKSTKEGSRVTNFIRQINHNTSREIPVHSRVKRFGYSVLSSDNREDVYS